MPLRQVGSLIFPVDSTLAFLVCSNQCFSKEIALLEVTLCLSTHTHNPIIEKELLFSQEKFQLRATNGIRRHGRVLYSVDVTFMPSYLRLT